MNRHRHPASTSGPPTHARANRPRPRAASPLARLTLALIGAMLAALLLASGASAYPTFETSFDGSTLPPLATGSGDLTESSAEITNLTTSTGAFAVGQAIEGEDIPVGTTVEALGAGTLTLSQPATATHTADALTANYAHPFRPGRIAVDETSGDVYVMDTANNVVDKFSATGTFITTLTGSNNTEGSFSFSSDADITVDNNPGTGQGNLYVVSEANPVSALNGTLYAFDSTGAFLWEANASNTAPVAEHWDACGIAVDATHHPWVSNYADSDVLQFSTAGALTGETISVPTTEASCHSAFDSAGNLFIAEYGHAINKLASPYTSHAVFIAGENFDTAVDTADGSVYGDQGSKLLLFNSAGTQVGPAFGTADLTGNSIGVTVNGATETAYVSDESGKVLIYDTGGPIPPKFTLALTTAGTGHGEVTSSSGAIACAENTGTCSAEYFEGEKTTLTAAPTAHNKFTGWSGPDAGSCATELTCEVTMSAARSLTATFEPIPQKTLTVVKKGTGTGTVESFPSGPINCGATCSAPFDEGSSTLVKAVPDAHNKLVGWTGCTASAGALCQVEMSTDKTVEAEFAPIPKHTVTVTVTGSASVSGAPGVVENCTSSGGTCSGEVEEGTTLHLTNTPAAHNHLSAWAGCTSSTGNECTVEVTTANVNVTATNGPITHTVKAKVEGSGSVSADSGAIAGCTSAGGAVCEGPYNEASEVKLTATPAAHQKFVSWTGCTTTVGAECKLTVPNSGTPEVKAKFAPITHTLTVNKAGSGSVTCNGGACAATYNEGESITLAATAASGSSFTGWSGGGCSGTGACKVTLEADTTVTATFTVNPVVTPPPPPPPPAVTCKVPKLAGKSLGAAKSALKAAHCALGKVTKPKKSKGALVVKSTSPGAGKVLANNAKVNLKLGPKPKKKH